MLRWDACLDHLERELDTLRSVLDRDGDDPADAWSPPTGTWSPPTDLGPLPARCRERAASLVARLRATVEQLDGERGAVTEQLGRARDRRDAARTYGSAGATEVDPTA